MEASQFSTYGQGPETEISDWNTHLKQQQEACKMDEERRNFLDDFSAPRVLDWEKRLDQENRVCAMYEDEEPSFDYMVCDSSSRLVPSGFTKSTCKEEVVIFVNAGGEAFVESDTNISFLADKFFQGGDVFRTDDCITEGGDFSFIYQSARLGNFSYKFDDLPPGDYYVDLHFVEIINVYGPKGMRVFNVFLQEEKVLSDFDIFSVVGANKPLQLVDSRVSVKNDEAIVIRFEAINGSPVLSGICIRRAPKISDSLLEKDFLRCQNCDTEIEVCSPQKKAMRKKLVEKYEKRIHDLSNQFLLKNDECYQAWMSLTAANNQLEQVRMELDDKVFQTYSLDQTMEKQSEKLRDVSSRFERDRKYWAVAVYDLENKIKVLKQEHSQLSHEAHMCADSVPELNKMVYAVQSLVAQCEDLKMKYNEEQAKRRKLHNQIEDLKGNIRVFCRCRPLSKAETLTGCSTILDFDSANDGELGVMNSGATKKTFKFDRVFTPKDDQADVFVHASPLVISVLDGYNVCIFAYGQTGTGKTFTMEGTEENRGVNYRTLEQLFVIANERSDTFTYNISVSVLEVYNEQIRDLLATQSSISKKLEIKQASEGSHHIPGIVEAKVENIKEVWDVLQAGSKARVVGSNNVNEHSSRSHCMLCIMVRAKNLLNGECTKSKLWLVDLAGSERLAKTDAQGDRLKEAQNINRSLSALGDVISALASRSSHIPYRNSKLTHLLQDSLGGDSKTLMFVQISPSELDFSETLSSLNFATRVRGVELGPARKQVDTSEIQKLKTMLDKARQECKSKEELLRKLEENMQNLEGKARGKDQLHKSQLEKIKELECKLELKTALHCQSEKQLSHLSERLKGTEEHSIGLQQNVKDLENKLREREKSDFITYQQKVRDLEDKLKAQVQESKSHSTALQDTIEELERKLKDHERSFDSSLHQKIKELEEKLREKERRMSSTTIVDPPTPFEVKHVVRDELMNEAEHNVLSSSNAMNRQATQTTSSLLKRNEPPGGGAGGIRRKRLSRNSDIENIDTKGGRESDPPRPPLYAARVTRTTTKPAITSQRPLTHTRTINPTLQGNKEMENKKRMWSR